VKAAAEILNMMGTAVETSVLDFVREADGDLAQKIMDNMFTFDDLEKIDDKGFQALLKEVQSDALVLALKAASARAAREGVPQHVQPRRRDAEGRPRIARPGQALRGRKRAEGNAEDRPPPGGRRPDRAGWWWR
jgi:hypothetical protein